MLPLSLWITVIILRLREALSCSLKWLLQVWSHFRVASAGWLGIHTSDSDLFRPDIVYIHDIQQYTPHTHTHTHKTAYRTLYIFFSIGVARCYFPDQMTASSVHIAAVGADRHDWCSNEKIDATSQFRGDRGQLDTHTHTHTDPTTCTQWAEAERAAWRLADYNLPFWCNLTHVQMWALCANIYMQILLYQSHLIHVITEG